LIKGVIYGLISLVLVSLQPIFAVARPGDLDAYFFAATTCTMEALIFLPLFFFERRRIKKQNVNEPNDLLVKQLYGWKKHKILLVCIGIIFSVAQITFFLSYQLAGAINGSLAQQSLILFSLLFGYLINHEKVTKIQILFSFVLLVGLFIGITQLEFNIGDLDLFVIAGVLLMMFTTLIWSLAHTFTRSAFQSNELTPIFLVFVRNVLCSILLFGTYFIFFPLENLAFFLDPYYLFFIIIMGFLYGFDVLFWYSSLSHIQFSKASVLVAPMPILTAFFAFLILGVPFTIFHLVGAIIITISIIIIVIQGRNEKVVTEPDKIIS